MQLIQSSEQMAAACQLRLDQELRSLLRRHAVTFEEFGEDMEIEVLAISKGDSLAEAERACGKRLVIDDHFVCTVELIARHTHWFEVVCITSDDGSGLVLLVEIANGTNKELMLACERALAEAHHR